MPCKWDRKPCLEQGCSEWDCAGLRKPEDCRHWEPPESCGACTEVGIHPANLPSLWHPLQPRPSHRLVDLVSGLRV